MHGQRADDAQRHGLILRPGEGLLHPRLQHFGHPQHLLDIRVGTQDRISQDGLPEALEADKFQTVSGHLLIENRQHGLLNGLEGAALFGEADLLEGFQVIRVNGKQPDILIQALVHGAVVFGKRREVRADLDRLIGGFFQQARGHDKTDVLAIDQYLRETLVDASHAVSDVLEAHAVEDGFLNARDKAKLQMFGELADLAEDGQVAHQFMIPPGLEVLQELIDHHQQSLIGIVLMEGRHHRFEGFLEGQLLIGGREDMADTQGVQESFQLVGEKLPQGHFHPANLDAQDFEATGDGRHRRGYLGVPEQGGDGGVFRHQRQHRHQV